MASFRTGVVTELISLRPGMQRVMVDGRPAYALTQIVGELALADRVVVNTTALDRGLGTGGSDVVHWNLSRDSLSLPGPGHVMSVRYTSVQHDAGTWDTDDGPGAADGPHDTRSLVHGVPVVGCVLHSHAMALCAAICAAQPTARVAFVMNEAGALPLALSDLLAASVEAGTVSVTASVGQAFGGAVEAVTTPSAVAGCVHAGANVVVLGPGPGHVGTADPLAFSGLSLVGDLDLLRAVGCRTALALRWSSADLRDRHRGLSHHSATLLELMARDHEVPVPDADFAAAVEAVVASAGAGSSPVISDPVDVAAACSAFGLEVSTMGRALADDRGALSAIGAAARWAAGLSSKVSGSTYNG